MRTDHILVALDAGGLSTEVVQATANLARPLGARVTLLTVVSAPPGVNPFGSTGGQRNDQILDADASNDLEPYVALLERDGIEVAKDLAHGDPAAGILAAIDRHQPGFLIMGTHGRQGLVRLLSGSVAESVIRAAPVPVLTVRSAAAGLDPTE